MLVFRVTEVLDYFTPPALVEWKVTQGRASANKILRDTGKHGSRIDELVKTGKAPTIKDKPEVHSCYKAFLKWKEIYDPKEIVAQTRLYGKINGYEVTGEPDLLIDAVLHDLKGTNALRKKNWIQVNVYEELRRQNGLRESPSIRLLRLDRVTESYQYPDAQAFNPRLVTLFGWLIYGYVYYKEEETGDVNV